MTTPNVPDDAHGMDKQNPRDFRHDDPGDEPTPGGTPSADSTPGDSTPAAGVSGAEGRGTGASAAAEGRGSGPDSAGPDGAAPDEPPAAGSGAGEPRADGPGPDGPWAGGPETYGETSEEDALRSLMRDAVQGIQASPAALEHLRRAIPLRRQRRRQAILGTAAAVLLAGMAIPAVIRAAGTTDETAAAPVNVASSHPTRPGEDGHTGRWGDSGATSGRTSRPGAESTAHSPRPGTGPKGTPNIPAGTATPVPDCSSAQLGQGASQAAAPDSGGRVYGWFRLANVSDTPCTVPSGGVVQAVALGAADQTRIQVVAHTQGDPASGLPSSAAQGPVLLGPGQDYEVDWAWVPAATGPGGCLTPTTPPTSTTPTATETTTSGPDQGGTDSGAVTGANAPQSGGTVSTPPQSASVALSHTPAAGAPEVDGPVIQDACAGTVYTAAPVAEPNRAPGS